MKKHQEVETLLKRKDFLGASTLLEEILKENPDDVMSRYNLGMCFSERGDFDRAIETLHECVDKAPDHSNAYVALGFACSRKNQNNRAKEALEKALALDPGNAFALRNLGGVWGKLGNPVKALYFLKKASEFLPEDPLTVYGLAIIYQALGDMEAAEKHFRILLEIEAPGQLHALAKDGLREIAVTSLKSKGFRADAVLYLLGALEMYNGMPLQEVQRISFEIGLKGQDGLDINNPRKKYSLNSLQGEFTGLQLVCCMYAGFRLFAPGTDTGVDLSDEYGTALKLFEDKESRWDLN